jgi:nucleoid-associated protein YgaU
MGVSGPVRGLSLAWRIAIVCGFVFVSFFAIQARGQDPAEAARQEKARKAAQQETPRHVYTEEDLKRKKILTPEDHERIEARKREQNAAPAEQNAEQTPPKDNNPQNESLGEVARRFRQESVLRRDELAAKRIFAPFQYEIPEGTLAAPDPGVAPLVGTGATGDTSGWIPSVRRPTPNVRISPFQPRPLGGRPSASAPALKVAPGPGMPSRLAVAIRSVEGNAPAAGTKSVEVQQGQSWWKLAEIYLGDGARWPELRALNGAASGPPELLKLGSTVWVPERSTVHEPSRRKTITVQEGDSLWSLAREHLGRGSLWNCLANANTGIVDYTHLAVGARVQLPEHDALESCRAGSATQLRK